MRTAEAHKALKQRMWGRLSPGPTPLRAGQGDTNFLVWLSETVASAVRTAEAHEVLKQAIRAELAAVESRFDLAAVQARTCLARVF